MRFPAATLLLLCIFVSALRAQSSAPARLRDTDARTSPTAAKVTDPVPVPRMKFALVLTRHGVRSPTWTNARLDEFSVQPWPKWPVAPGILTPHGKELMKLFGAYYHSYVMKRGLLAGTGCVDAERVYVRADSDERTLDTGHAIAEGMFPGCRLEVHGLAEGVQDELFHRTSKVGADDRQRAYIELSGRMGGDPAALTAAYKMPLETMQRVLIQCEELHGCKQAAAKNLLSVEASLLPGNGDHLAELKGPLSTAATFAEDLQLEYLEGMPAAQVGWGRVDEDAMRALMMLHAASSDLVQRTPAIARVQAANLMTAILNTLEQAEKQTAVAGAVGPVDSQVVFLVGHDTNIANVAALLDLHWLVNGYQRDDAAPGGALVFELWQTSQGEDAVKVYYTVHTTGQMRTLLPLSLDAPPARAALFVPGCSEAVADMPCTWTSFHALMQHQSMAGTSQ